MADINLEKKHTLAATPRWVWALLVALLVVGLLLWLAFAADPGDEYGVGQRHEVVLQGDHDGESYADVGASSSAAQGLRSCASHQCELSS